MEGYITEGFGADNEDGAIGLLEQGNSDSHPQNSAHLFDAGPEYVHLIDDDLRITDDEFKDALYNIEVRRTRRVVAYMQYSSGEEVDQMVMTNHNTQVTEV
ncbi:hypothetical protein LINPERPRIM_LOCUS16844 [Linum perenne]